METITLDKNDFYEINSNEEFMAKVAEAEARAAKSETPAPAQSYEEKEMIVENYCVVNDVLENCKTWDEFKRVSFAGKDVPSIPRRLKKAIWDRYEQDRALDATRKLLYGDNLAYGQPKSRSAIKPFMTRAEASILNRQDNEINC